MKKVYKYATGQEIPEGVICLSAQVETTTEPIGHPGDNLGSRTLNHLRLALFPRRGDGMSHIPAILQIAVMIGFGILVIFGLFIAVWFVAMTHVARS